MWMVWWYDVQISIVSEVHVCGRRLRVLCEPNGECRVESDHRGSHVRTDVVRALAQVSLSTTIWLWGTRDSARVRERAVWLCISKLSRSVMPVSPYACLLTDCLTEILPEQSETYSTMECANWSTMNVMCLKGCGSSGMNAEWLQLARGIVCKIHTKLVAWATRCRQRTRNTIAISHLWVGLMVMSGQHNEQILCTCCIWPQFIARSHHSLNVALCVTVRNEKFVDNAVIQDTLIGVTYNLTLFEGVCEMLRPFDILKCA